MERLARFRFPGRRDEWLAGRITAKTLVSRELSAREGREVPLTEIEIVPEITGAPAVRSAATGAALPISVTISHSAGRTLSALLFTDLPECAGCSVGADLEKVELRSDGFVRDFLTGPERREVEEVGGGASVPFEARAARANGIWSAKESVLKALKLGLTVDTWRVECLLSPGPLPEAPPALVPEGPSWNRFSVRCAPEVLAPRARDHRFFGFWREEGGYLLTIAVASL
jgi:4'-phosphopantetheinyl transferase